MRVAVGPEAPDDLCEGYLRHNGRQLPDDFVWNNLAEVATNWNEFNEINGGSSRMPKTTSS